MKEFIKYPKIGQYRNAVKIIRDWTHYQGQDEDGNPIIDESIEKPVLRATGTVKLHGTNAGVVYDLESDEIYAQSRTRVITVESDNAGFAFFVESNKDNLKKHLKKVLDIANSRSAAKMINESFQEPQEKTIAVFGEWCGGNIQKGVALAELDKMFVVFDVKIGEKFVNNSDLAHILEDLPEYIKSAVHYKTYHMDIDFNNPEQHTNLLVEITNDVENECPVAKEFGISGIGEGVVWKVNYNGEILRFKVKGQKHSSSKVKKLAQVDPEKLKSIEQFVDYAVTENRLKQGIEQVFTANNREIENKGIADFVKWVKQDIFSEEKDVMVESSLEPKDVMKQISQKSVDWLKKEYL